MLPVPKCGTGSASRCVATPVLLPGLHLTLSIDFMTALLEKQEWQYRAAPRHGIRSPQ